LQRVFLAFIKLEQLAIIRIHLEPNVTCNAASPLKKTPQSRKVAIFKAFVIRGIGRSHEQKTSALFRFLTIGASISKASADFIANTAKHFQNQ